VLAVSAFRKAGWVEPPGVALRLEIEVREPAVKHTVTLSQLQRWGDWSNEVARREVRREQMRKLLNPQ
jgi:hypothetical protein